MRQSATKFTSSVVDAVRSGLFRSQKSLPSWLFYDEEGDHLFQQIMRMPEYYPTRCEYDILKGHKQDLLLYFQDDVSDFRLVELGAGDGLKSEILLAHFVERGIDFTYVPVDISRNALELLSERLRQRLPQLRIDPLHKSYDEVLSYLPVSGKRRVILFLGANIGNFTIREAVRFLKRLAIPLSDNDMLLIGFDLKKDPRIIQEAYDDPRGLTASFNLNILKRLNREAGAEFDLDNFSHYPYYDPENGTTKSFLISLKDQQVHIAALERDVHFYAWEPIQTEVSQKYDVPMIEKMMVLAGLRIKKIFMDAGHYYCDVLVTKGNGSRS